MPNPYSKGRPSKFTPSSGKGELPPNKPGEYKTKDDDGNILYVGEGNLRKRMYKHIDSGLLDILNEDDY